MKNFPNDIGTSLTRRLREVSILKMNTRTHGHPGLPWGSSERRALLGGWHRVYEAFSSRPGRIRIALAVEGSLRFGWQHDVLPTKSTYHGSIFLFLMFDASTQKNFFDPREGRHRSPCCQSWPRRATRQSWVQRSTTSSPGFLARWYIEVMSARFVTSCQ